MISVLCASLLTVAGLILGISYFPYTAPKKIETTDKWDLPQ